MPNNNDLGKKVVAAGLAATTAVVGGVAAYHHAQKKDNIETLEPLHTSSVQNNVNLSNNDNEYHIGSTTFVVSSNPTGIFGNVIEATTISPTSTTMSEEEYFRKERMVQPSRFNTLEEMYVYYDNVWKTQNKGLSALEAIQNVDNNEDELNVAASLQFLREQGLDPVEFLISPIVDEEAKEALNQLETNQLELIQISGLIGREGLDSRIEMGIKPLIELFPKDFLACAITKSFISLNNEIIALINVKQEGETVITYNGVYLTADTALKAQSLGYDIYPGAIEFLVNENPEKEKVDSYVRK